MDIGTLIAQASVYLPPQDLDLLRRAYARVEQVCANLTPVEQGRANPAYAGTAHAVPAHEAGKAHIQHCLNVAAILVELNLDAATVAAGLLHDVVEDSRVPLNDIEAEFGPEVRQLVDGMARLQEVDESADERVGNRSEREAENLRKMIIATVNDPRVILIKLADRLYNMRTLRAVQDLERRRRIAKETLDVFAPLAGRLGMYRIKWELEDLGFRYHDPKTYQEIARELKAQRQEREREIAVLVDQIKRALDKAGIRNAQVTGRPKHIYSIYKKMQRKGLTFKYIYDVRAIRIIVDTVADCYHALGIVHSLFRPAPSGFDDYIAVPKDNGYQSLHTDVIPDDGKSLEVQIRTYEMDQVAELGIAAHWKYKEARRSYDEQFEAKIRWLQSLLAMPRDEDAQEFAELIKTDLFQDQVYVFTPRGEAIELPVGATPIDFAYLIHTEVGHRCRGARVNGRLVPLNYQLQTGDRVEILTTKSGGPSRDWLNKETGYVKTARARQKIRQWFRRQAREQNIERGIELIEKELRRLSLDLKPDEVADLFMRDNHDEFFARVGTGDMQLTTVITRLAELMASRQEEEWPLPPAQPQRQPTLGTGVRVKDVGDLLTTMARCCNPVPGEEIVGYVTRGRGVTIHRKDCPNILRSREPERLIQVSWGQDVQTFPVRVKIRAYDRARLLRDIGDVLGNEDVSMVSGDIVTQKEKNLATFTIVLQVTDIVQFSRVLARIEQLPNVLEARRITG